MRVGVVGVQGLGRRGFGLQDEVDEVGDWKDDVGGVGLELCAGGVFGGIWGGGTLRMVDTDLERLVRAVAVMTCPEGCMLVWDSEVVG